MEINYDVVYKRGLWVGGDFRVRVVFIVFDVSSGFSLGVRRFFIGKRRSCRSISIGVVCFLLKRVVLDQSLLGFFKVQIETGVVVRLKEKNEAILSFCLRVQFLQKVCYSVVCWYFFFSWWQIFIRDYQSQFGFRFYLRWFWRDF